MQWKSSFAYHADDEPAFTVLSKNRRGSNYQAIAFVSHIPKYVAAIPATTLMVEYNTR